MFGNYKYYQKYKHEILIPIRAILLIAKSSETWELETVWDKFDTVVS